MSSIPDNEAYSDRADQVYTRVKNRIIENRSDICFALCGIDVGELCVRFLLTIKYLVHQHTGDVFLHKGIDSCNLNADITICLPRFFAEEKCAIEKEWQHAQCNECQFPIHREHIAVVLQDVFLFSGDIQNNIHLGDETISQDRVKAAARMVGANRFIEALPNAYNAEVKERGATLSVGQKQLLSFARALAFNPRILVLDEATSSVDTETELLIQQAIKKMLVGRTSIVIAHRLSTIQSADKIIVLHKGEIREMGNHQELLALNGIYRKLYELQYKDQETKTGK